MNIITVIDNIIQTLKDLKQKIMNCAYQQLPPYASKKKSDSDISHNKSD